MSLSDYAHDIAVEVARIFARLIGAFLGMVFLIILAQQLARHGEERLLADAYEFSKEIIMAILST